MPCNQRVYNDTHKTLEHNHSESRCFPDDVSAPVTLTGAAGANTFGSWVEIIASGTLNYDFDIHYISLENFSGNDTYRIDFSIGAGNTAFGTTGNVKRTTNQADFSALDVITGTLDHELCDGSTQSLYARVKTAGGGSDTVDISVIVHPY
jgi:hypothetical protein